MVESPALIGGHPAAERHTLYCDLRRVRMWSRLPMPVN